MHSRTAFASAPSLGTWPKLSASRLCLSSTCNPCITRCIIAPDRAATTHDAKGDAARLVNSQPVPDLPGWRYTGPSLSLAEPCAAVIYLALTATQSLELDPFNQLITARCLHLRTNVRIFSPTLPFHSDIDMLQNERVFHEWAAVYAAGGDVVSAFVRNAHQAIQLLVRRGYCLPGQLHVAGLSRGGLLAGLLCAECQPLFASCLLLAPVTSLGNLTEMKALVESGNAKVAKASLVRNDVVQRLVNIPVRVYMGNMDRRVGTKMAFEFAHLLAETAAQHGIRSPPHEFIMYCRYGFSFLLPHIPFFDRQSFCFGRLV